MEPTELSPAALGMAERALRVARPALTVERTHMPTCACSEGPPSGQRTRVAPRASPARGPAPASQGQELVSWPFPCT